MSSGSVLRLPSLFGLTCLNTLEKEVQGSEAYELNRRRHEGVDSPPTPEFEAKNDVDSHQQQIPQDSKASSSSGEHPALSLDGVGALTIDKGIGTNNQPTGSTEGVAPARDSYPRRMIGDFDDSANALWSLHEKEAKSHDEARIQSLKDDMDSVLIFVRCPVLINSQHRHCGIDTRPSRLVYFPLL